MISYFLFVLLLGLAIVVIAIIIKFEGEKRRLNKLLLISNQLLLHEWTSSSLINMVDHLKDIIPMNMSILWLKENNNWGMHVLFGEVRHTEIKKQTTDWLNSLKEMTYFTGKHLENNDVVFLLGYKYKSFILAPIFIEDNLVGIWQISHHKRQAYSKKDIKFAKAAANQMAVIMATKRLVDKKERNKIMEERKRIAREIHDGIAQKVAGTVMKLEAADKSFGKDIGDSKRLVQESIVELRGSLKDIRQSIYDIRTHVAKKKGIVQAIKDDLETFKQENTRVEIHFQAKGVEIPLGYHAENTILNIFKEAMRNIEKHAHADLVLITVFYKENQMILKIKDNGQGFSIMDAMIKAKKEPHFGIINMHELADRLDSKLDILTEKGAGTELTLLVSNIKKEGGIHDKRYARG